MLRFGPSRFSILVVLAVLLAAGPVRGGDDFGKVDFPTSCSSEAQPVMVKGVALLHSFQYQLADQTFGEALKLDPQCAMAHWGKAMSLYHQLWDFPQPDTLRSGLKEIEEAHKLKVSRRENGYLVAAAVFFRENPKLTHLERTEAYSESLSVLRNENPEDVEAAAFYALNQVALAYVDRAHELAHREAAIKILAPLLASHPDNPGVAHYMIHATDTPTLASRGLEAARVYAKIAPDSSHAIHMPSHIFVRLGLWQETIASNLAAREAGAQAAEMHHAESHYQTHAMDFLSYAYLQSGQEAKARELIASTKQVVGASDDDKADVAANLAARTAIELHRSKEAASLPVPKIKVNWLDTTYWARVIGMASSGEPGSARSELEKLKEAIRAREQHKRDEGYEVRPEKPTDLHQAEAWLLFSEGKTQDALREMRAAAESQERNGDESLEIPSREMLADMLLELKRPADALTEYKIVLGNSPNRFNSLYGAAQAARAAGQISAAKEYDSKLLRICASGADRPELSEARALVAQK